MYLIHIIRFHVYSISTVSTQMYAEITYVFEMS